MAALHIADAAGVRPGVRPSMLRRGERIRRADSLGSVVWTFLRYVPREAGRPAHCVLQSDDCRGQNGPGDQGIAIASVYEVSRHFVRVQA